MAETSPGFSAKRILGPGSDYKTNASDDDDDKHHNDSGDQRRKRRRRNSDHERNVNNNNSDNADSRKRNKSTATGKRRQRGGNVTQTSAADLLNQGLASERAGFSVEEMEALRAAKKNATSK